LQIKAAETARHLMSVAGQALSSKRQAVAWLDLAKTKKQRFTTSDLLATFERVMYAVAGKVDRDLILDGEFIGKKASSHFLTIFFFLLLFS
jgi:hypothetical protein